MRFALLGDHADGLAAARALVQTGRHELLAVLGESPPAFAANAKVHADVEEILADPAVELVIVATDLPRRGDDLRRALQSERHVLCAHPCAANIDRVYEAALMQAETGKLLLPLMSEGLHPALTELKRRLQEIVDPMSLMKWELPAGQLRPGFTGWTILRRLGGDIAEISGVSASSGWAPDQPLFVTGRFEDGQMFQIVTGPASALNRLTMQAGASRVQLDALAAWSETIVESSIGEKTTIAFDAWPALVAEIEVQLTGQTARLSWHDAIRCQELDDALRRSIEKRRSESLDYQEVSADSGSKGTITLIGCAMLWLMLLIFGLSIWVPWIRWAIVPLIVVFLGLILLRVLGVGTKPRQ